MQQNLQAKRMGTLISQKKTFVYYAGVELVQKSKINRYRIKPKGKKSRNYFNY